ncbi:Crt-like 1 [Hondaea fermentalgiana]|uniref:Crt-like 1 n=1 Tax=Hondaea fermentalgiana TaxID=2315210 RepID=A0A2R5GR31_9STRA|nr:Crt-like 1 [Hondaea fermentalgiana]|eukprot:GBG32769.1 Crt-like 1 [Hondaea fermentalgiana]
MRLGGLRSNSGLRSGSWGSGSFEDTGQGTSADDLFRAVTSQNSLSLASNASNASLGNSPRGPRLADNMSRPLLAENDVDEQEAATMAQWGWRKQAKLLAILALLILCGSAETISYTVNGKVLMAPYRCFLDQAVVLTCIIFFSTLYGLEEARRRRAKTRRWLTPGSGRESRATSTSYISDEDDYNFGGSEGVYDEDVDGRFGPGGGHGRNHGSRNFFDDFDERAESYLHGRHNTPEGLRRSMIERARAVFARHQFFWLVGVMALCDTIALYINLLASHGLGGALRLILQQLSIPMSMGLSALMLGRSFSRRHVIGAIMVLLGVVLCLVNVIKGGPGQSDAMWTVVFAISCFPLALGGCLKEWVLTQPRFRCDAHQLNAWVAIFQFVIGLFLVPLGVWIQNRDMDDLNQIERGEIMANFIDGFRCGFLGLNTYDPVTGHPAYGKEDCSSAAISTWTYIITVCAFNLLMLIVIDEGSAVLFFVANGVIIPVVSVASASPLYSRLGLPRDSYTVWQFIGLTCTVGGCFYFGKAVIQRAESDLKIEIMRSGGPPRQT